MPAFSVRRAQITAIVTGVVGVLLALATPLLPVKQTVAEISWPQSATIESVSAPLFSYTPIDLDVTIPCTAVEHLPDGKNVLLSTTSPSSPKAPVRGLFVRVTDGDAPTVEVVTRNIPVLSTPLSAVRSPECRALVVRATADEVSAEFVGLTTAAGKPVAARTGEGTVPDGDKRPQVTGLFTQLEGSSASLGVQAHLTVDSRYSTTPTVTKWLAIIVGVLCTLIALAALARLDATDRRGHRRIFPARWWRLNPRDYTVIGMLLVWHIIGPNTSDDGYLMTMARVAQDSDYTANYFRWFGAPEAPFGWYYQVFGLLSHVSVASPWMRLPALACGIASWLIISHEVLPRIGRAARQTPAVPWTAAVVFLAAWFPFNNGLRPEPIICLGALLTWCSVERAIATGRLLPAAIAAVTGAFSIAAGPTGLLAVAALVAGARPIFLALRRRAIEVTARTGRGALAAYTSLLAPIAAAGTFVIFVVFAQPTLRSFTEASAMKSDVGPSLSWYNEIDRYSALFAFHADGSLGRRFTVLLMILAMTVAGTMLVRKSRIPGTALGPSRRIVGITLGALLFLMFTPTKWTHHFGVFAGLAAALAALATIAMSSRSTHSRRNRTLFGALVLFVTALGFSAPNAYYYASAWGMPWSSTQVTIVGMPVADILLTAAMGFGFLALWFHFREPFTGTDPSAPAPGRQSRLRRTGSATARVVAASPIGMVAGAAVVFLTVTAAMTGVQQSNSFSVPRTNLAALAGKPCGMADRVWVETDPSRYLLNPVDATLTAPLAGPAGPSPIDDERVPTSGFTPNGIPDEVPTQASSGSLGILAFDALVDPDLLSPNSGGTSGGVDATTGVNGSHARLPFQLDRDRTPVLGSYSPDNQMPAALTSGWYRLPADFKDRPLITASIAGRFPLTSLNIDYTVQPLNPGIRDGQIAPAGTLQLIDPGPRPSWRNARVDTAQLPDDATAIRIVGTDYDLAPDRFMVVTPPRLPVMSTLQETVGSTDPTHVDWTSGLFVPCQRPFNFHAGIAETPKWRIRPGGDLGATGAWQGALGGGPLGWLEVSQRADTVATYLRGDLGRDWGALERYTPYDDAAPAKVDYSEKVRSGLWTPAPIRD